MDEFCRTAVRHHTDQTITGQWTVYDGRMRSASLDTNVNNLDFRRDLLLRSATAVQRIGAPKRFQQLQANNIVCESGARLQTVDVAEWIAGAVLSVGNNYTIQGTVELHSPTVFGDVRVFGLVNNRTVAGDSTIWLKSVDQQVNGTVRVIMPPERKAGTVEFRPFAIRDAHFETVNGRPLDAFLKNAVMRTNDVGDDATVAELTNADDDDGVVSTSGALRFQHPPTVGHLYTPGLWDGVDVPKMVSELHENVARADDTERLGVLHRVGEALTVGLQSEWTFSFMFVGKMFNI